MVNILELPSLYCFYYQTTVQREFCWLFTAALRSYEHISFDRTINPELSIFEIFVVPEEEELFLLLMQYFKEEGIIDSLMKLPNRLQDLTQQI